MTPAAYTYPDGPSTPAASLSDPNAWVSEMMEMDTDTNYDWVLFFLCTLSCHPSLLCLCLDEFCIVPVFAVLFVFVLESYFGQSLKFLLIQR